MINRQYLKLGIHRFIILFVFSLAFVWGMSEIGFFFFKEESDRAPQDVELIIPPGTADKVAAGEEVPSIPDSMVFVVGDNLIVKNDDSVDHQLGPVWVPAGASASLAMDNANTYDYSCSFRPSRYLGLDIREPTTINTRLIALGYVTPATALFFFVYSLIIWPLKPKQKQNNK